MLKWFYSPSSLVMPQALSNRDSVHSTSQLLFQLSNSVLWKVDHYKTSVQCSTVHQMREHICSSYETAVKKSAGIKPRYTTQISFRSPYVYRLQCWQPVGGVAWDSRNAHWDVECKMWPTWWNWGLFWGTGIPHKMAAEIPLCASVERRQERSAHLCGEWNPEWHPSSPKA